jgi:hypothetical protein
MSCHVAQLVCGAVVAVQGRRTAVESRWTANADARPLRDLCPSGSLPRSIACYLSTCSPQPASRRRGDRYGARGTDEA